MALCLHVIRNLLIFIDLGDMNKKHFFICMFVMMNVSPIRAQENKTDGVSPIHRVGVYLGMSSLTNATNNTVGDIAVYGRHKTLFYNMTLRYDFFFHRHWGVYAEFFVPGTDGPKPEEWIPMMEDHAKGYDYAYTGDADNGNHSCSVFTVGVNYRQQLKSWEIQPSVGIGLSLYDTDNTIKYLRKESGTNNVEQVEVMFKHNDGRYPILCVTPGVTIMKHIGKRIMLGANISYTLHLQNLSAEYRRTNAYTHEVLESYSQKIMPGHFLRLGLGISVQLGNKKTD